AGRVWRRTRGLRVLDRRRGRPRPRREAQARPARKIQAAAHRAEADARADDRGGRDRRPAHRARALDLRDSPRRGEAPLRELRRNRKSVLPQDENLSDHAYRGHPPRAVPRQPLDRAVAPQGVRAGAAKDLRNPRYHHGTGHDAALASRACRGGPPGAGRRLVALRLRAQPPRAGNVPALSPRAGALEEAAESGRASRSGDARVLPGVILTRAMVPNVALFYGRRGTSLAATARGATQQPSKCTKYPTLRRQRRMMRLR